MTTRPQDISDRIDCWLRAYQAVLAELKQSPVNPREPSFTDISLTRQEIAARTAATLAIGATSRERGGE